MPWSRSRMPSSYAAPPTTTSSAGRLAVALHAQPHVGDRAVERVVLGSVRVRVDPADHVLARGLHAAHHAQPLAGQAEVAAVGRLVHLDPPARAAERLSAPVQRERPAGHPGRGEPAELDPAERHVEPFSGAGQAVQPDPALGVLGTPVVPDHPAPAVDGQRAPVDHQGPVEARRRRRAEQLRARQLRPVHPVARQVEQRRLLCGEAQVPLGAVDRPGGDALAHRRLPHSDPVTAAGGRSGQRRLVRPRALRGGVEKRHPERAGGRRPRALVHRVADPHADRLGRVTCLQVEALVVAGVGGQRREAGLGGVRSGHGRPKPSRLV